MSRALPLPASRSLSPLVLACLAATWLIWGSTYLAIKFALVSLPPFVQMGTRFLAAGAVLAAWQRWRGQPWPTRRQWRHAALVGALMLGGGMGCTAYAEQSVASGLVVVFIAIIPALMAAAQALWRVYPSRLEACGIGVGLLGVVLLTRGQGFQASPVGLVAIGVACTSWVAGSLLSQHRWPLAPGAMGFASEMLCGGLLLMVMAGFGGEYGVLARQWPPTPGAALAWLYLVVAGSLLAFNAYMVLLARSSAGLASSYCFVNPLIALALGVSLGAEVVSTTEWAASGIVLAGVGLLLLGRR